MSKKYQIINSNVDYNIDSNDNYECTIFYLLYIVLFFVIVFIIYKIIFCFKNENFENVNKPTQINMSKPKTSQEILNNLKEKNNELNNMKSVLQNKLLEQSQAIYLSQNFNKVDPSSYNDQLSFLMVEFADTKFPEINFDEKKIINTQTELDNILTETSIMKNFYKPGEIVDKNSTFGIGKNEICYRHNNKPIKPTPEFLKKYPNCMVCAIEDENNDLKKTNSWINTKTNISKVCLYDPNAKPNSGIPNLEQCKNFCNINNN